MEMLSIIFSIIGITIPILVIGVVVYIIVVMTKNKEGNIKFKLSTKTLLQIYLYVISFLTLGIAVIGGSIAIKSSLSYVFGTPFSYTLQKVTEYDAMMKPVDFQECYTGESTQFYNQDFCFDPTQRKTDLINGLTLLISMSLLYILHQYALSKIDKEKLIPWLGKIYTFGSLILYSIVSIIAIPTAIYNLTNYLLFEAGTNIYSTPDSPAMAIAVALISIPLWIFFLNKTTQLKED